MAKKKNQATPKPIVYEIYCFTDTIHEGIEFKAGKAGVSWTTDPQMARELQAKGAKLRVVSAPKPKEGYEIVEIKKGIFQLNEIKDKIEEDNLKDYSEEKTKNEEELVPETVPDGTQQDNLKDDSVSAPSIDPLAKLTAEQIEELRRKLTGGA